MLTQSWNAHVCDVATSRKKFDIQLIDLPSVRSVVARLDSAKRGDFVNFLIGKHVTNDALVHYSKGATSAQCPLCDETDNREHRIHRCAALQDIRDRYADVLIWLQSQPSAVGEYALLPYSLDRLDNRFSCDPIPITVQVPDCLHCNTDIPECVYTDGSADFNMDFATTVAAGAYVTIAHGKVAKTVSAMLPGCDHSSYRGEVWAVLLALRDHACAIIHTDSAAVCSVVRYLLTCRVTGEIPSFKDHHDLWNVIWRMLLTRPANAIQIQKVKAHLGVDTPLDPQTKWRTIWNDKADQAAKKCIKDFLKGKKRYRTQVCTARERDTKLLARFADMWGEMTSRCREASKVEQHETCGRRPMPVFTIPFEPSVAVRCDCQLPDHVLDACPLGKTFAVRVCSYFHDLLWDPTQQPVGLLQVYFDFCLTTQTMAPVRITDAQGHEQYMLADQSIAADAQRPALVVQSRTWNKMMKWFLKVWGNAPFAWIAKAKSLHQFGYHFGAVSLTGSPNFRSKDASMQHLWQYFHVNGVVINSLSRTWQPRTPITIARAGA